MSISTDAIHNNKFKGCIKSHPQYIAIMLPCLYIMCLNSFILFYKAPLSISQITIQHLHCIKNRGCGTFYLGQIKSTTTCNLYGMPY